VNAARTPSAAAQAPVDVGVAREVQQSCHARDLGPGDPVRQALAVPALEDVPQRIADARRQPEALGEALADLAVGGQSGARTARSGEDGPGERGDVRGPALGRPPPQEGHQLVGAGAVDRREVRAVGAVVAVRRGGLVRVARAADRVQQPEVVGVGPQRLVAIGGQRQARAQRRRAQAVLERLVGPEVGGQRQGGQDLPGGDGRGRLRAHGATLCRRGASFRVGGQGR